MSPERPFCWDTNVTNIMEAEKNPPVSGASGAFQEATEYSVRFGSVRWFGVFSAVRFGSVRWKILTEPPNFLVKKWPEIGLFQLWFFQLFHEKFFKLFYKISENDFQHLDRCSPWLFREIFKQEKFGMVRFGSVTEIRFGSVRFGTVKSFSNSVRFGSVEKKPVRSFPDIYRLVR